MSGKIKYLEIDEDINVFVVGGLVWCEIKMVRLKENLYTE